MPYTPLIYKPSSAFFKKKLASVVFLFLGRAIKTLYHLDSKAHLEIDGLPDGLLFIMKGSKQGPSLCIRKKAGVPVILKSSPAAQDKANTIILEFKSISDALLVLLGRIDPSQAYAQHRFILYGDIYQSMPLVRCLFIAEAYLFPAFITRTFLTEPIERETSRFSVYWRLFKK